MHMGLIVKTSGREGAVNKAATLRTTGISQSALKVAPAVANLQSQQPQAPVDTR
jgi:hypothetical protein